jgi:hypothetical protein
MRRWIELRLQGVEISYTEVAENTEIAEKS